ncbi:MAG TPA: hypothetical protein VGN12_03150 [Pirellulales bacterium]|jgi:hypothetical protein
MARRFFVAACGLLLLALPAFADDKLPSAAAPDVEAVGLWADVDRVTVTGAHTFRPEQIRKALRTDLEFQVAGSVTALLAPLPGVIARRVRAGYQLEGFPRADVTAHLQREKSQIELSIEEGPRFTCGALRIDGAKKIGAERLREWLTVKHPRSGSRLAGFEIVGGKSEPRWRAAAGGPATYEDLAWDVGAPACFDELSTSELLNKVTRGLADQGYRSAKFDMSLPLDNAARSASLQIHISDEGPQALIDRIEVTGSERDTAEDVCHYLNVKAGNLYTDFERHRIVYQLSSSGRYLGQQVSTVASENPQRPIVLRIKLLDYDLATPLRDPLLPAEEALLKCREWVLAATDRGDDLTLRFTLPDGEVAATYSAAQGLMLQLPALPTKDLGGKSDVHGQQVFIARRGEILYLHAPWTRRFQAAVPSQSQIIVNLQTAAAPKRTPEDPQFAFMMGMGANYKGARSEPSPILLSFDLLPASILSLAHSRDAICQSEDGVLTITWPESPGRIRIEAATGRLLEFSMFGDEDDSSSLEVSIEQGAFTRHWREIEKLLPRGVADLPNDYDANRPLSSLLTTLMHSPLLEYGLVVLDVDKQGAGPLRETCQALGKLVDKGALAPLDDMIRKTFQEPADQPLAIFVIPAERWRFATLLDLASVAGLFYDDATFSQGSWPWRLWRDVTFQKFGRGQAGKYDLDMLRYSRQLGPVGRLLASYLPIVDAEVGTTLAISGLERLDAADFAADYSPLLQRGKLAGDLLCTLAASLRDLDDTDIAALDLMIGANDQHVLRTAAQTLRDRSDENIEDVLPQVLDQLWSGRLREVVEKQLRATLERNSALAGRPPVVYPTTAPKADEKAKTGEK